MQLLNTNLEPSTKRMRSDSVHQLCLLVWFVAKVSMWSLFCSARRIPARLPFVVADLVSGRSDSSRSFSVPNSSVVSLSSLINSGTKSQLSEICPILGDKSWPAHCMHFVRSDEFATYDDQRSTFDPIIHYASDRMTAPLELRENRCIWDANFSLLGRCRSGLAEIVTLGRRLNGFLRLSLNDRTIILLASDLIG